MNALFNACVVLLQVIAHLTGMTYEEVNVIFFVIIMPATFFALAISNLLLCYYIIYLRRRHKNMQASVGKYALQLAS